MKYAGLRRALDVLVAAATLLVTAPVLALIGLAIRVVDGPPVFFRQSRAGRFMRPFLLWKFRTMIVDADRYLDTDGRPTRERVTRVGSILRLTSLDELPQLYNVLRGDMALVGPRPVPLSYCAAMDDRQRSRFNVRPGLTGLAQVRGRHTDSWTQRLEHDLEYVERRSWRLDIEIILRTIPALLRPSRVLDRNPDNLDLDVDGRS